MSKGIGQKIAIQFSEKLVGDVTGLVPTPVAPGDYFRPLGTTTGSSRYSTTYTYSNAFDGNVTGSYWYTRTSGDQWVQIELAEPTWVYGFRWYIGSSYRPNGFKFQGSNDVEIWEDILTNNSPNETGWHEFLADSPKQYKYYRWTITSRYSSYLYVYEIELLSATGNDGALTITGEEYQYVNGPLILKEYKIDKVERYEIVPIWSLGDSVSLDGQGELEIIDTQCYEVTRGTTLTGTVQANEGDFVLATVSHRSTFTMPSGWTKLYESVMIGSNQRMVFAIKKIEQAGSISFIAQQSSSGRIYLNLISITGLSKIEYAPELEVINPVNTRKPVPVPDKMLGDKLIWGCSTTLWKTKAPYTDWETSPNDLLMLSLNQATTAPRQANFIDYGTGEVTGRTFNHSPETPDTECIIAAVKLIQDFETPKIHISQAIELIGNYRIRWIENKPESADILIEYATGQIQGQWQEVYNGDIVNADTNLWFRVTLETTDTRITPILQELWIEEPDAPDDQIRLVMHPQSRFNNVEGPLTVQYDQTFGSLMGRGGPVQGFTKTFVPADLEPKPNPHVAENIEVSAEASVDFIKVTYKQAYAEEQITVSASATVDFIYVGVINP